MNDMIHFESQIRYNVIFSSDHALFLPFNPRFCVIYLLIMQKRSTQILYQYLGTKVAEAVGFEPTNPSLDYPISSRGRYDHFDTLPQLIYYTASGLKKSSEIGGRRGI